MLGVVVAMKLIVLFVTTLAFLPLNSGRARILGGRNARSGQFPYFAIVTGGGSICGGSIIGRRLVLTAAHCVYKKKVSTFTVTVGTSYLNRGGRAYNASRLLWSSGFDPKTQNYDVGFVQVEGFIEFNDVVKKIPMATKLPAIGERLTLMGFGWTSMENASLATELQHENLASMSWKECQRVYTKGTVYDGSICTSAAKGIGACRGDSGGPLVNSRGEQVGIDSFGPAECGLGAPDVYSSIVYFKALIDTALKNYDM